jgi:hypothetical protein
MSTRSTLVRRASQLADPGLDPAASSVPPAAPSGRFAWLVTAASTWILVGLFVDGWFHINSPGLETFFTPWHALLYSGVAAAIVVHLAERLRSGGLPPGYRLSLVAGIVVSLAGFVDMVWHTVLGVEADLPALLSPPHLLLITAGTLVFAGPLRAALRGTQVGLPAAFSAAYVVTGLGFFTQYANPFTHLYPVSGYNAAESAVTAAVQASADTLELRQVAGVAGVVVYAVLVAGAVAVLRSRGPLPAGALLVAVAVPSVAMTTLRGTLAFVPLILVAAALVEVLGRRLGPAALATLAPALLTAGWAITLVATETLDWGPELMTGAVCSAAAAGYLVGWLLEQGTRARA